MNMRQTAALVLTLIVAGVAHAKEPLDLCESLRAAAVVRGSPARVRGTLEIDRGVLTFICEEPNGAERVFVELRPGWKRRSPKRSVRAVERLAARSRRSVAHHGVTVIDVTTQVAVTEMDGVLRPNRAYDASRDQLRPEQRLVPLGKGPLLAASRYLFIATGITRVAVRSSAVQTPPPN